MTAKGETTSAGGHGLSPVPESDIARQTNLTKNQLLLWMEQALHPGVPLYNMVMEFTILGEVSHPHFRAAFQALINSTDALRCIVEEIDGVPHQRILSVLNYEVEFCDFSASPDPRASYEKWGRQRCTVPFDLSRCMFDSVLVRLAPSEYVWFLLQHHLITDSFSTALVYRRMAMLYGLALEGELDRRVTFFPRFEDYRDSEATYRTSPQHARSEVYWKQHLADPPPPMTYYGRGTRASVARFRRTSCRIGEERTRRLVELAGRADLAAVSTELSQFLILGAVLFTYMARVSGNRRLAIGVPIRNRLSPSMNETVGLLMEVAPIIIELADDETFSSLIRRMRVEMYEVLNHYRFGTGNAARQKIYDVMLNYHPWVYPDFHGIPVRVDWRISGSSTGGLNLQVHDFAGTGGLTIEFDFNEDVFDDSAGDRAVGHFLAVLDGCLENPEECVDRVPMLSPGERELVLVEWNRTAKEYPRDRYIHELISEQAERTPDAEAVVFGARSLTYRELNQRSNQLANHLRRLGVRPETLVAICVDRSLDMVTGVLGVLKAGGAYLPLDPAYPRPRLEYMVRDAGAGIILTQSHLSDIVDVFPGQKVFLDSGWSEISREAVRAPESDVTPGTLAYVIYTSGSTGQPKGVMVEHRGIVNLARGLTEAQQIGPGSRVLQFASISFDAWVPDVVTSLSSGATLCIPSQEQLLPGGPLEDYMQKEHISAATLPPSVLATMVTDNLPYLRSVVSAGEACTRETAARWSRTRKFINGYGPTEATVCTSLAVSPDVSVAPVIGRPLQNLQVYIIDRYLNPQPIGVPGELCVAGVGVARGYLGRPELTAERFPANPFPGSGSERMYRTGDLVRYHPDGNIEYLGRIDQQVKLRGFRIELGEIEAAISSHPNVQHCAVVLREDVPGEKKLVAYIVPADSKPPALLELRDHLKERLPDYMVPSAFVLLDVLPLSPNGKVDKKALPPPAPSAHVGGDGYDPPRTDLERTVAAVYAEVLRLPAVGRNDNFFEIGGQSLIAMQVITRIRASLNVDLRVHHLFDHPSVASLAELLSELAPSREEKPVVPPEAPAIDVNALSDEEVERMLAELLRQQGGKP